MSRMFTFVLLTSIICLQSSFVLAFDCESSSMQEEMSSNISIRDANCGNVIRLEDDSAYYFQCAKRKICNSTSIEMIHFCGRKDNPQKMFFLSECLISRPGDISSIPYSTAILFSSPYAHSNHSCFNNSYENVLLLNGGAVINSPHWPETYRMSPNSSLCKWKIDVPINRRLKFFFLYLNLQGNDKGTCSNHTQSDYLNVDGRRNNKSLDSELFCGKNPSFAKFYNSFFDAFHLELYMNRNTGKASSKTGFVIGIVVFEDNNTEEYLKYWWLIVFLVLILGVIMHCLRKKISQHNAEKKREKAFENTLNTLSGTVNQPNNASRNLPGYDNLGQVVEEPSLEIMPSNLISPSVLKPPVTQKVVTFNLNSASCPSATRAVTFAEDTYR